MNWPPLESDPEIFTNYFRSVGMSPNFRFDEIYTLDMELDCLAIIGAFRCVNIRDEQLFLGQEEQLPYFIKQLSELDNACGLIAGLHALFNTENSILEDSLLDNLKQSISGKDAQESGQIIANCQELKQAHSQYSSEGQSSMTDSPDYHFVCFLPGQILVDGCKQLPVRMQAEGSFSLGFFQIVKDKLEEGLIGADLSLMALVLEQLA